jgi:hypothetical protein
MFMKGKHLQHENNLKKSRFIRAALRFLFGVFLLIIIPVSSSHSQTIASDEWINTSQTYLRIAITNTGFYSISGLELREVGVPIEDVPASAIQIFRRGKEVAIEIKNDQSGKLNDQSSISFFGESNDGQLDSALYTSPNAIPHSRYSLYSDTAFYFITWRHDTLSGKRISKSQSSTSQDTLNYHFQENEELFTSNYNTGNFYPPGTGFSTGIARTEYDVGEGWTGKALHNSWQTLDINTSGFIPSLVDQCEIELVIVGRAPGKHEVEIWVGTEGNLGRKINTLNLSDFSAATSVFNLNPDDIAKAILPNGKMILSVYAKTGTISASYIKWRYPKNTSLVTSNTSPIFHFGPQHYNSFWNTGNNDNWDFYDFSDPWALKIPDVQENGINLTNASQIIAVKQKMKVNSIQRINFTSTDSLLADYLIISHPAIRKTESDLDPVAMYASYRSSWQGGNYKVGVINIDEVFNRFNYGEPGPAGIRNMIKSLSKQGSLKFVFLIGRSSDPQTARKRSDARTLDMIPNAGWPGSDLALAMNIDSISPHLPVIPVGRINASTAEEVAIYLQKVKEMEAQPASASWRKNILHLSGGRSFDEIEIFKAYTKSFESKVSGSHLAAHIETVYKQTEQEIEQFPFDRPINKGIALMTLFGHSGIDVTDIDIGYASDDDRHYKNRPFYPAVIANGCALGSIFHSSKTISSDWIFSPDKGAVLFLAHTFNGLSSALKHYTESFYEVLSDMAFTSQPFGNIQKEAIRRNLQQHKTLSDILTAQQMNLHGDPAIRIFPAKLPDYTFDTTAFKYTDGKGNVATTWSDSLKIKAVVNNHGRYKNQQYQLTVMDSSSIVYQIQREAIYLTDTLSIKIANPFSYSGTFPLTLFVDPENELEEESEQNNEFKFLLTIREGGVIPLLPTNNFVVNKPETELVAQLSDGQHYSQVVFEWDSTMSFTTSKQSIVAASQSIAKLILNIEPGFNRIYWRVYIPEHPEKRSLPRIIIYDPEVPSQLSLPEALVFINNTPLGRIQEGDFLKFQARFQNITNLSFNDSISVEMTHTTPQSTETRTQKIAALNAYESKNFLWEFPTIGFPGRHLISVVYNSDSIPETIYSNNAVHFNFEVIPDRIPPILTVNIDNRQLANNDVVSSTPQIDIQIADENRFLIRTDTTGIEVYIREDCHMCPEKRISLNHATTRTLTPNTIQIRLTTLTQLTAGQYRLRVRVRDVSGNVAPEYHITFNVANHTEQGTVVISPNPSLSYFRFSLKLPRSIPNEHITLTIFNSFGSIIHRQTGTLHAGKTELFWKPDNLPSGIYFYRIENADSNLPSYFGVNNNLRGKVIWLR